MFGGPIITKARDDGKMPWSPTVVNINRMRNRRRQRSMLILAVIGVLLCCACSYGFYLFAQRYTIQPGTVPQSAPIRVNPTSSPEPLWTPISESGIYVKIATHTPTPKEK